jgi:hypothetical protein
MRVIRPIMRRIERGMRVRARAPKVIKPPRPISKLRRKGYPKEWATISRRVRFERAKGVCERCGKRHGEIVYQGPLGTWQRDGRWFNERGEELASPPPWPNKQWWRHLWYFGEPPKLRRVRVMLHTAHLDHNPANCADENLAALCQACHLRNDVDQHRWSSGVTRDRKRGQRVLFAPAV